MHVQMLRSIDSIAVEAVTEGELGDDTLTKMSFKKYKVWKLTKVKPKYWCVACGQVDLEHSNWKL